ncbi:MAG: hypothetical protein V1929_01705 [bacterium]
MARKGRTQFEVESNLAERDEELEELLRGGVGIAEHLAEAQEKLWRRRCCVGTAA